MTGPHLHWDVRRSLTPIAKVERTFRADFDVATSRREIAGIAIPYDVLEVVSDDGLTTYEEGWRLGVFERATMPANTGRVKLNYTHNDDTDLMHWIGRTMTLRESAEGLIGLWKVDQSPFGDAVLYKVADGQLPGMSVSARILANSADSKPGVKVWRASADLRHVALVEHSAFAGAVVTAVREAQPDTPNRVKFWQDRITRLRS